MKKSWLLLVTIVVFGLSMFVLAETDEDLPFLKRVAQQEQKDYDDLVQRIKTMPKTDYKKFLWQRINSAYSSDEQMLKGLVMIDVSDEKNQDPPNFIERLFQTPPVEAEYGLSKVETHLDDVSLSAGIRFGLRASLNSGFTESHYQVLEGDITKPVAESLLTLESVVDIHIQTSAEGAWSSHIAFDESSQRLLPPKKIREYSSEFLKDGLYSDVMKRFERDEIVLVAVSLKAPTDEEYFAFKERDYEEQELRLSSFLDEWQAFKFEELGRSSFTIYLKTTRDHVEAMINHDSVEYISLGDGFYMGSTRP